MSNDAYYNSDNLMSDGHDNMVAHEEDKQYRQMVENLGWDLKRFPLPICFDPIQEQGALNRRMQYIGQIVERWQNIRRIRFNKKYSI